MEIGWIARGMKSAGEFEILGMEEVQVMDAVGMERSTWFRAIQIAEGFKNLKKSEYLKLYSGKAYVGLKLPESDRYKPHWLARMCDPKLSTEEFEEIVAKKIEAGEVKQDATSVEDRDWFKVRLYKKDLEQCRASVGRFLQGARPGRQLRAGARRDPDRQSAEPVVGAGDQDVVRAEGCVQGEYAGSSSRPSNCSATQNGRQRSAAPLSRRPVWSLFKNSSEAAGVKVKH